MARSPASLAGRFVPEQRALRALARATEVERRKNWLAIRIGHLMRYRMARAWGLFVHPTAEVGDIRLPHPTSIVIGAHSVIEDGAIIYQQVTIGSKDNSRRECPVIRAGARVFAGAVVVGGVEVGDGAVVGANAVVVDDVAAGATVVGNPARPVGRDQQIAPE